MGNLSWPDVWNQVPEDRQDWFWQHISSSTDDLPDILARIIAKGIDCLREEKIDGSKDKRIKP